MSEEAVLSVEQFNPKTNYFVASPSVRTLRDTVCLLTTRRVDGKICLQNVDNHGWWFPFKEVDKRNSWQTIAKDALSDIGSGCEVVRILEVCQTLHHLNCPAVTRITFLAQVEQDLDNADLSWFSISELQELQLRSPEPFALSKGVDNPLFVDLRVNSRSTAILEAAGFTAHVQELLYHDIVQHVYPCRLMNLPMFKSYLETFNWYQEKKLCTIYVQLFRALDVHSRGYLTPEEVTEGLAAMDPSTPHGGSPAETRCRYIFRYYDGDGDSLLEMHELKSMISDMNSGKEVSLDSASLDAILKEHLLTFQLAEGEKLSLNTFLHTVGQLKFRGTSGLFRCPQHVPTALLHKIILDEHSKENASENSNPAGYFLPRKYDLATHFVKVRRSGALADVKALWDMEGTAAMSKCVKLNNNLKIDRIQSVDSFNLHSEARQILNGLSFFEHARSDSNGTKPALHWGHTDPINLAERLICLCRPVRRLLAAEDRLLRVPPPAYVLGDLHGNYPDLSCFEATFWRLGSVLTPASILFLGDYVDRGEHGVEVVAYLFTQKILSPDKFFLLRGNHEVRSVQKMFTFHKECLTKFGERYGTDVWNAINECFDVMPLAAIIDGMVFCVHGGIPAPWLGSLNAIREIPCPLPNPERDSPLAWELMWNDPSRSSTDTGFSANMRRRTGHTFTASALESFLRDNGLSHVIRAHEVQQAGFKVQLKGYLLTVFSSSGYCGGKNEAACVLVERRKLRTIRIDTSS